MMNKRKKVVKYRGSKTHGGGSMKKRRGAGSRGGRGNAGSGKKGDVKKPSFWKEFPYVGKSGFTSQKAPEKVINIYELNSLWNGKELNLTQMGYDRLLGRGSLYNPVKVKIARATAKAIQKIEKAKGSITVKTIETVKTEE